MNAAMTEFFYSGLALEIAMAFMVVEAIALLVWNRCRASAADEVGVLVNLLSGLFLMTSAYFAVMHKPGTWLAACLIGSLVAHLTDLLRRIRGRAKTGSPTAPRAESNQAHALGG